MIQNTNGEITSMQSASFQFVYRKKMAAAANRENDSITIRMTHATIWRTASRSPVRRVIRSPVRYVL